MYSIGHSSRDIGEFVNILRTYGIDLLVDVRIRPYSSRFPHFSKESLEETLRKENIGYLHLPQIGGFRREGYANFTRTEQFRTAINRIVKLIRERRVALMCAERDWRRCHRRFIADHLTRLGIEVVHIIDEVRTETHPKGLYDTIY